jgi:hypothetical protein
MTNQPTNVCIFVWNDTPQLQAYHAHLHACGQCRRATKTDGLCDEGCKLYLEAK